MERKITIFLGPDTIGVSDLETQPDGFGFSRQKILFTEPDAVKISSESGGYVFEESGTPDVISMTDGEPELDYTASPFSETVNNENFFSNKMRLYFSEWDWQLIQQSEQKKAFIDSVAKEFDKIAEKVQQLYTAIDIDRTTDEIVPYLAYLLGHQVEDWSISSFNLRELTKNLIGFYSIKGTNTAYEKFFRSLGFDVSLDELWWEGADEIIALTTAKLNYLKKYGELSQASKDEILRRIRTEDVPYASNPMQRILVTGEVVGEFNDLYVSGNFVLQNQKVYPQSLSLSANGRYLIDDGNGNIMDGDSVVCGKIDYNTAEFSVQYSFEPLPETQSGESGEFIPDVDYPFELKAEYTYIIPGEFYNLNKSNYIKLGLTKATGVLISNIEQNLFPQNELMDFVPDGSYNGYLEKDLIAWKTLTISDGIKTITEDGNGHLIYNGQEVGTIDKINGHYVFEFDFYESGTDIYESGESGGTHPLYVYYKYDNPNVITDVSYLDQNSSLFSPTVLSTSLSYLNFLTPVHINKESILSFMVPIVENLTNYYVDFFILSFNPEHSYATKIIELETGTEDYTGYVGQTNLIQNISQQKSLDGNYYPIWGGVFLIYGTNVIQANPQGKFLIDGDEVGFIVFDTGYYNLYNLDLLDLTGISSITLKFDYLMLDNENLVRYQDSVKLKGKVLQEDYYNTHQLKHNMFNTMPINPNLIYKWRVDFESGEYESGTDRYTEETQKEVKWRIFNQEIWERGQIFSEQSQYMKLDNSYTYIDGFGTDTFVFNKLFYLDLFRNKKTIEELSHTITPMFFDSFWGYPIVNHSTEMMDDLSPYWDLQSGYESGYEDESGAGDWSFDLNFDFFKKFFVSTGKREEFDQISPLVLNMATIPIDGGIKLDMCQQHFGNVYTRIKTEDLQGGFPSGTDDLEYEILRTWTEGESDAVEVEYNDIRMKEYAYLRRRVKTTELPTEPHMIFRTYLERDPPPYGPWVEFNDIQMINDNQESGYEDHNHFILMLGGGVELQGRFYDFLQNKHSNRNFQYDLTYQNGTWVWTKDPYVPLSYGQTFPTLIDFLSFTRLAVNGENLNESIEEIPWNISLDSADPESGVEHGFSISDFFKLFYFLPSPETITFDDGDQPGELSKFMIRIINFDWLREYKTHGEGMVGDRTGPSIREGLPATRHDYFWDEFEYRELKNGVSYVDYVDVEDNLIINKFFV